jgi:hypothetical protein
VPRASAIGRCAWRWYPLAVTFRRSTRVRREHWRVLRTRGWLLERVAPDVTARFWHAPKNWKLWTWPESGNPFNARRVAVPMSVCANVLALRCVGSGPRCSCPQPVEELLVVTTSRATQCPTTGPFTTLRAPMASLRSRAASEDPLQWASLSWIPDRLWIDGSHPSASLCGEKRYDHRAGGRIPPALRRSIVGALA